MKMKEKLKLIIKNKGGEFFLLYIKEPGNIK